MIIAALAFAVLSGISTIIGILTAAEVLPMLNSNFDTMFWLVLSGILMLTCIAASVSRSVYE
jgi:hypothetical protein